MRLTPAGGALIRVPAFARGNAASDQLLRYLQPAASWIEAPPLGNDRFGAMVFGRVAHERLQLNEDTLWSGSPYTPDNPDALTALPEVRRLRGRHTVEFRPGVSRTATGEVCIAGLSRFGDVAYRKRFAVTSRNEPSCWLW